MAINETQKLSRLARHSQEEFFSQGSLLNQTRLNRFILIALFLHASVIILQSLITTKPKDALSPPQIRVKYVDIQKTESIDKKETPIEIPKPKKAEKQKTKPSKQKKHRKIKPVTPQTQVKFKKEPARSKQKSTKNNISIVPADKGAPDPEVAKQRTILAPSKNFGSRETLSMLNRLDVEKYAMQDTRHTIKEDSDYDELISLDTKEAKYISYFNRIKHQIQRVWMYPTQAVKKGISGQLTLKFQISREGNLLGVSLIDNSGFEILDIAAVKAIKEAAPYYPFPLTIPRKKLSILATFVYSPNFKEPKTQ